MTMAMHFGSEVSPVAILGEAQIRTLIGPREALAAVRDGFAKLAKGQVTLPEVMGFEVGRAQGEVHVKCAYIHDTPYYSIKVASGFYSNETLGIPANNGLVLVFDAATGQVRAILLDNGFLTELRTGAAGGLAADLLARRNARRVGMVGCGSQARYQLEALCVVREVKEVTVYGRSADRASRYVAEIGERFGINGRVARSVREAVEGADIVVTATPARQPVVQPEWVSPGTHITAVGSDGFGKQELDIGVLARASKIVVDHRTQSLTSGEMRAAVEGGMDPERIYAELGELAAGLKPGRTDNDEITVADLTGVGVQDAAVASEVVQRALEAGAREMPGHETS